MYGKNYAELGTLRGLLRRKKSFLSLIEIKSPDAEYAEICAGHSPKNMRTRYLV